MKKRSPEEIDRLMAENARLWCLIILVCLGMVFVFSLGDWGWLLPT